MSYDKTKKYLDTLKHGGINYSLTNIKNFLALLGNPQDRFKSIIIGGTNGKGSVAAFLSQILVEAGYKIGLFSSPYLIKPTECIKINNKNIPDEEFSDLVLDLEERINFTPTFFEFKTAVAFSYFAKEKVDLSILEVGLGGRCDTTNVSNSIISIITNISYDHTNILGKDLISIANEKAGIIKKDGILITGEEKKDIADVFMKKALELNSKVYAVNRDFYFEDSEDFKLGLRGKHQIKNACLAVQAVKQIKRFGFEIKEDAIKEGLKKAYLSGRLEFLYKENSPTFLLDCAHNLEGINSLANFIRDELRGQKIVCLVGIMIDKDYEKMVQVLDEFKCEFIFTKPNVNRAWDNKVMGEVAGKLSDKIKALGDVPEAIDYVLKNYDKDNLIVVTGSIFTVGETIALLKKNGY